MVYRYERSARLDVLEHVPETVRSVLDIGCGAGDFGRSVRENRPGTEVWGVDTSQDVQYDATRNLDRFVLGAFPDVELGRRFGCITFNDSLEHISDPWAALQEAHALLEPDGLLLASIPNVRNYAVIRKLVWNGEWTYQDRGILDRTHLRFFTRKSACQTLSDSGFDVERTVPVNLSSAGRAVRLLSIFGSATVEFRSQGFIFIAHPRRSRRVPWE